MKSWIGKLSLGLTLGLAIFGCAQEREPINRVQPNALKKSFFVGESLLDTSDDPEFYKEDTLVDVGYGASMEGMFTSGYVHPVSRIKWEVTENRLIARLTYERIAYTDGKVGTTKGNEGQIVAAYPISSHFDIRRSYNPSTGEEQNVVEENASDRPWYEREYFRVDWSQNQVTSAMDFDALSWMGLLLGISYEPVQYFVNDPTHPDAPVFTDNYFDITQKVMATPQMIELPARFGGGQIPGCFLPPDFPGGEYPVANCNPVELKVRVGFKRVVDTDYEPVSWDGVKFRSFGAWAISQRYGYSRNYGLTDDKHFWIAERYNLWQKSHAYSDLEGTKPIAECATPKTTPVGDNPHRDVDNDGTEDECATVTAAVNPATGKPFGPGSRCDEFSRKCTIPYQTRQTKPVVWYAMLNGADDMYDPTDWSAQEWDIALRTAVQSGRLVECRAGQPANAGEALNACLDTEKATQATVRSQCSVSVCSTAKLRSPNMPFTSPDVDGLLDGDAFSACRSIDAIRGVDPGVNAGAAETTRLCVSQLNAAGAFSVSAAAKADAGSCAGRIETLRATRDNACLFSGTKHNTNFDRFTAPTEDCQTAKAVVNQLEMNIAVAYARVAAASCAASPGGTGCTLALQRMEQFGFDVCGLTIPEVADTDDSDVDGDISEDVNADRRAAARASAACTFIFDSDSLSAVDLLDTKKSNDSYVTGKNAAVLGDTASAIGRAAVCARQNELPTGKTECESSIAYFNQLNLDATSSSLSVCDLSPSSAACTRAQACEAGSPDLCNATAACSAPDPYNQGCSGVDGNAWRRAKQGHTWYETTLACQAAPGDGACQNGFSDMLQSNPQSFLDAFEECKATASGNRSTSPACKLLDLFTSVYSACPNSQANLNDGLSLDCQGQLNAAHPGFFQCRAFPESESCQAAMAKMRDEDVSCLKAPKGAECTSLFSALKDTTTCYFKDDVRKDDVFVFRSACSEGLLAQNQQQGCYAPCRQALNCEQNVNTRLTDGNPTFATAAAERNTCAAAAGVANCENDYKMWTGQQEDNEDAIFALRVFQGCARSKAAGSGGSLEARTAAWKNEECFAATENFLKARRPGEKSNAQTPAIMAVLRQEPLLMMCHSPVIETDHPLCGDVGFSVRYGDMRYNIAYVTNFPQQPSAWGILANASDPVTGEIINAAVNVWNHVTDVASQGTVDTARYINGELSTQDVTEGKYVKDWVQANEGTFGGASQPMSKAEIVKRLSSVANVGEKNKAAVEAAFEKHLSGHVNEQDRAVISQARTIEKTIKASPSANLASALPTVQARMEKLKNTEIEAQLMNQPMLEAAGSIGGNSVVPPNVLTELASPLRQGNVAFRQAMNRAKHQHLAERGACLLEAPPPEMSSMIGLARILAVKFKPVADETANQAQERAVAMKRYVARQMHHAVIAHEMGHAMGSRHNFVSSYDAFTFRPQYWQLRTKNGTVTNVCTDVKTKEEAENCVGPRYFDPVTENETNNLIWMWQQSSIMEYPGDITGDMIGIAAYDFAHARATYTDVVSVFAEDFPLGTQAAQDVIEKTDTFGGITGITMGAAHYSQIQNNYQVIRDCEDVGAPETWRPPFGYDESRDGAWHPVLDGQIVSIDNGVTYSRCRQHKVDYVSWKSLRRPVADDVPASGKSAYEPCDGIHAEGRDGQFCRYGEGPNIDKHNRLRVPYSFASDEWADIGNVAVFRHDQGADPYEQYMFLLGAQENKFIFDHYRRNRATFAIRPTMDRDYGRYTEKVMNAAKGLALYANLYKRATVEMPIAVDGSRGFSFYNVWPQVVGGQFADNAIAASIAMDHFARQITRPQDGPHYLIEPKASNANYYDPVLRSTDDQVFDLSDSVADFQKKLIVPTGSARLGGEGFASVTFGGQPVNNALDREKGDYARDFMKNVGSYYAKINAIMALTESADNFISESRTDFVDSRYRATSMGDLFPEGFRRLVANLLTNDAEILGPRVYMKAKYEPTSYLSCVKNDPCPLPGDPGFLGDWCDPECGANPIYKWDLRAFDGGLPAYDNGVPRIDQARLAQFCGDADSPPDTAVAEGRLSNLGPGAINYGYAIALDDNGNIVTDAQGRVRLNRDNNELCRMSLLPDVDENFFPRVPIAWNSFWPEAGVEVCSPQTGAYMCRLPSFGEPTNGGNGFGSNPLRGAPLGDRPTAALDPQIGWEVQKYAIAWTYIFLPENRKTEWFDMMRVYRTINDQNVDVFKEGGFLVWRDPFTGTRYAARRYGVETIHGKQVERGIAARVIEYANQLTKQGFVLDTAGGPTDANKDGINDQTGEPLLKLSPNTQQPIVAVDTFFTPDGGVSNGPLNERNCSNNRGCVALKNYKSVVEFLMTTGSAFRIDEGDAPKGLF